MWHILKHIFNENSIPRRGVADQHVRDCADKPPVLNDRGAAHALDDAACFGKEGGVGDGDGKAFGAFGIGVDVGDFDLVVAGSGAVQGATEKGFAFCDFFFVLLLDFLLLLAKRLFVSSR